MSECCIVVILILLSLFFLYKWCLDNVWMISEWYLNDVWTMSAWCPAVIFMLFSFSLSKNIWIMSEWCLYDVWIMSEWCLNDVSIMFGYCLNDVWTMSGWCPAIIFIHFDAFVVFCYLEWSMNDVWMCLDDVWMMSGWCLNHVWMMSCCHFDPVKIFYCLNAAVRLLLVPVQSPPHGGCELVRVNLFYFSGGVPRIGSQKPPKWISE